MLGQKNKDEEKGAAETRGGALERFSQKLGGDGGTVSIVGKGMHVVGDVTGRGGLRIEGEVEGTVRTDGNVVVVDGGEVDGDVSAAEVVVAGKVSGTIEADKAARFKSGCRVDAEIASPAVEVEEGAVVNGRIDMTGETSGGSSSSASSRRSAKGDSSSGSGSGGGKGSKDDDAGKPAKASAGSGGKGDGGD